MRKRKQTGRQTIRRNAAKGAAAEKRVAEQYRQRGYRVKRTGRGHDFVVTKRGARAGSGASRFVEVKSGSAVLSPLQRHKKRMYGRRYVVKRVRRGNR